MKSLFLIASVFITSCADLPDPLTCDRADPDCVKASKLADRKAERKRQECPSGVVCIRGQYAIEQFKRNMRGNW